jgi:hypothetical protein
MVPTTYHAFLGGCAGVAGTLIGLLFVAISVSPHKHVGSRAPLAFHVQAGVAITTLIDALIVALVALLPGQNLGTATVILAGVGLSATIGLIVLSVHDWPGRRHLWGPVVVPCSAFSTPCSCAAGSSCCNIRETQVPSTSRRCW